MKIEFDAAKSARNKAERGLPFSMAADFDWAAAIYTEDRRFAYPEARFIGIGPVGPRLHVVCFTPIAEGVRIISFRKANHREVKRYEKETEEAADQ